MRIAYVSNIPRARREEMQARLELAAAADAMQAGAANVADAAIDAADVQGTGRDRRGRPHERVQEPARNSG